MIALDRVAIAFNGENLFQDVSFRLNERERIGLVGRNGSGKSTLLRIIDGTLAPSQGAVAREGETRIGHLAQHIARHDRVSVLEETLTAFNELAELEARIADYSERLESGGLREGESVESVAAKLGDLTERFHMLGGDSREALAERALTGLGFERSQLSQPTAQLSGGWRMRIELAKILIRQPNVLLLDEPTNHLDIESIEWLEQYLSSYTGALVLISHDRRFLDTVTKRTIELSLGKMHDFGVPYTEYTKQRAVIREQQLAAWQNQQKEIEKTEAFIERFRYKATKSNQVQARVKALAKMERVEVEAEDTSTLRIRFPEAPRSGDIALDVREVSMRFGEHLVFENARFTINRGEKVAFVGRNGEGKTTLARIILGELAATSGVAKLGHNVALGYFAQNQESVLDGELTVFDTIDRVATGPIRTKIRDLLAAFLFRGEDIDKPVKVLSGGERNRLAMVKLMLRPYNLLLLDEPTNHLDIQAKDILKQALQAYNGTLILVSHDRDFLSGLVDKVYEFGHQRVREHLGGIDAFLATRRLESLDSLGSRPSTQTGAAGSVASTQNKSSSKEEWQQRKAQENRIRKCMRDIQQIEERIAKQEEEIKELEARIAENSADTNLEETLAKYHEAQHLLAGSMKRWEELEYEREILERGGGIDE